MPLNEALELRIGMLVERPIPVLAGTIAALARMGREQDSLQPREVAQVVLRDPMFTLVVLRHLQTHRSLRKLDDISTVEHAIMMLGLSGFFAAFGELEAVEDTLAGRPEALEGLLEVLARARAASLYAGCFASLRMDLQSDKVVIAALLRDMAEMLLWCFDPDAAIAIRNRMRENTRLRSMTAQRERLGFSLLELQLGLGRRWGMPEFLRALMDDAHADKPRVKNVVLAVALSRHSALGWSNPALPDDLADAARLLGLKAPDVHRLIFDASLRAIAERGWYGNWRVRSFLPPLPAPGGPAGSEAERLQEVRTRAHAWLQRLASGQRAQGGSTPVQLPESGHDALTAVAAALDGMGAGLGFRSAALLIAQSGAGPLAARLLAGDGSTPVYLKNDPVAARTVQKAAETGAPMAYFAVAPEPAGVLAWPLVMDGRTVAVAVVSEAHRQAALSTESFCIFKEFGVELDAALTSVDLAGLLDPATPLNLSPAGSVIHG